MTPQSPYETLREFLATKGFDLQEDPFDLHHPRFGSSFRIAKAQKKGGGLWAIAVPQLNLQPDFRRLRRVYQYVYNSEIWLEDACVQPYPDQPCFEHDGEPKELPLGVSPFMIWTWFEQNLKEYLDTVPKTLTCREVVSLLSPVASAVATFQSEGFVHRDLKLENLMIRMVQGIKIDGAHPQAIVADPEYLRFIGGTRSQKNSLRMPEDFRFDFAPPSVRERHRRPDADTLPEDLDRSDIGWDSWSLAQIYYFARMHHILRAGDFAPSLPIGWLQLVETFLREDSPFDTYERFVLLRALNDGTDDKHLDRIVSTWWRDLWMHALEKTSHEGYTRTPLDAQIEGSALAHHAIEAERVIAKQREEAKRRKVLQESRLRTEVRDTAIALCNTFIAAKPETRSLIAAYGLKGSIESLTDPDMSWRAFLSPIDTLLAGTNHIARTPIAEARIQLAKVVEKTAPYRTGRSTLSWLLHAHGLPNTLLKRDPFYFSVGLLRADERPVGPDILRAFAKLDNEHSGALFLITPDRVAEKLYGHGAVKVDDQSLLDAMGHASTFTFSDTERVVEWRTLAGSDGVWRTLSDSKPEFTVPLHAAIVLSDTPLTKRDFAQLLRKYPSLNHTSKDQGKLPVALVFLDRGDEIAQADGQPFAESWRMDRVITKHYLCPWQVNDTTHDIMLSLIKWLVTTAQESAEQNAAANFEAFLQTNAVFAEGTKPARAAMEIGGFDPDDPRLSDEAATAVSRLAAFALTRKPDTTVVAESQPSSATAAPKADMSSAKAAAPSTFTASANRNPTPGEVQVPAQNNHVARSPQQTSLVGAQRTPLDWLITWLKNLWARRS